jgi:hypothetical protein
VRILYACGGRKLKTKNIVWSDLAEICTITVTYYARYYGKEDIEGSESMTSRVEETRKLEREGACIRKSTWSLALDFKSFVFF